MAFQVDAFQEDAFQIDGQSIEDLLERIEELEQLLREARSMAGGPDPVEMWDPRPERIARNNQLILSLVGAAVSGKLFGGDG